MRVLIAGLLLILMWPVYAERATDQQVKAEYLYNFMRFVDWQAMPDPELRIGPLRLCFLGENSFGDAMQDLLARKTQERPLQLMMLKDFSDADVCHVLYFNKNQSESFSLFLASPVRSSALTVSDMDDFAQQVGMIGLLNINDRVRLEINQRAVQKIGLPLSAKVFEVALRIYNPGEESVMP